MNKIFVINGFPGSGKTTFGNLIAHELELLGVSFRQASSIDPIKELLRPQDLWTSPEFVGDKKERLNEIKRIVLPHGDWDGQTKDEYWRGKMSDLKGVFNRYDPWFINSWVIARAKELSTPSVTFVDIRETQNIEDFKNHVQIHYPEFMVRTVWVESDKGYKANNISDGEEIANYQYDIRVNNNRNKFDGHAELELQSLKETVHQFAEMHIIGNRRREII